MADRILTKGLKTGVGVGGVSFILRRGLRSSGITTVSPSVLSITASILAPSVGPIIISPSVLSISVSILVPVVDVTDNKSICMNANTLAVTEYINFNYNSYTLFNGKYIALNKTGIYELGGSNDDSVNIVASLKTGTIDTYSDTINRLRDGYVTFRSDGDILLKTIGNKINERLYPIANSVINKIHERRIKGATNTSGSFERGIKDRYFSFELLNVNGSSMDIDKLRIAMEPIKKRR